MTHTLNSLGTAALLSLLAACAGNRPAADFTWLGRFDSWEPLGKDHLLVYTRPNEAYLLKVSGPCDVRFATGPIGITSTNYTVYAGLDSIAVNGGPGAGGNAPSMRSARSMCGA